MFVLEKYIIREHAGPFIFSMATIILAFLMNVAFRDLARFLGKGIPFTVIIEFFFLNLAWILALAVPMAVLIAALMAFGRLSADNEITALKAAGMNVFHLIRPVLFLSFLLAFFMERFNNVVLPEFNFRAKQLYADIMKKKPGISLEPNVFFNDIPQLSILVKQIDQQDRLQEVLLHDLKDHKTIVAREGFLDFHESEERLVLTLYDGEMHEIDPDKIENYKRMKFQKHVISVKVHNIRLKRENTQNRGDREKSAAMMREDIRKERIMLSGKKKAVTERMQSEMDRVFRWDVLKEKANRTAEASIKDPDGRPEASAISSKRRIRNLIQQCEGDLSSIHAYKTFISRYRVEIHKKYSIPVACIVFILIGAPLGIMSKQGSLAAGGILSLFFFIIYWAFLIGGESLADRQKVDPALSMWAPNILVGALGIILVLYSIRESTFIPWEKWAKSIRKRYKRASG